MSLNFVLSILLVIEAALAGPLTVAMSCAETYNLVLQKGSVTIRTPQSEGSRLVAHEGLCAAGEQTAPVWVPTLDEAVCFVGYSCTARLDAR